MPTSLVAIATKALEENYFFQVPDTEASTVEEPGARKRHAGIRAGAVRATGRPTAMPEHARAKPRRKARCRALNAKLRSCQLLKNSLRKYYGCLVPNAHEWSKKCFPVWKSQRMTSPPRGPRSWNGVRERSRKGAFRPLLGKQW